MKLYIYNENCVMAGREVPASKIEAYEISGQDPDEAGDWTCFEGEPDYLLQIANTFSVNHGQYGWRIAETIRAEVYRCHPELEPEEAAAE